MQQCILVVWLFGCLVVWLFGCLVVWLFGHWQNVEVSSNSKTSEMVLCRSDFIEIVISVVNRTSILCSSVPTMLLKLLNKACRCRFSRIKATQYYDWPPFSGEYVFSEITTR